MSGNAAEPSVLIQAHIADAAMLVIASPDTMDVRQMAETARALNPKIEVIVRTHNEEESVLLQKEGIGLVFFGEAELARGMASHVLERFARADGSLEAEGHWVFRTQITCMHTGPLR